MPSVNLVACAMAKTCEHATTLCDYMSKSPILFLIAIDWITTNTTADTPSGLTRCQGVAVHDRMLTTHTVMDSIKRHLIYLVYIRDDGLSLTFNIPSFLAS